MSSSRPLWKYLFATAAICCAAAAGTNAFRSAFGQGEAATVVPPRVAPDAAAPWRPLPAHATGRRSALDLLQQAIPDATPNAAQVRRGQALVAMGDCLSCHLREGGAPFAGGLALRTPFGTMFTSNITSDPQHGIGRWTPEQFYRAMHDGIDDEGHNLYPAFPYPWFRAMNRVDDDAVLAFLKTVPPSTDDPPPNQLHFPFNLRFLVKGWNLLFLKSEPVETDAGHSAEWNRGRFLVDGPGHCSACHSPKNAFGADERGRYLQSGVLEGWVAPDLTSNGRTGLGAWSVDDIVEFLKIGRNARAGAGGTMAEVITYSTSLMSDADLHAIAVYLQALPASADVALASPDPGAIKRGAAIYDDVCSSCHLANGVGQPRFFPPLGHDALVQQNDPTGVIHVILGGSRIGTAPSRPSPMTMPAFAWKLDDAAVADVTTYVRNGWGNRASPVTAAQVRELRKTLGLEALRLTDQSGDR